jgi:hypothetical protein
MLRAAQTFVATASPDALDWEAAASLEAAGRDAAAIGLSFVGLGPLEAFCPGWNGVAAAASAAALAAAMDTALFGQDAAAHGGRSLQLARARFSPFSAAMARATAVVDRARRDAWSEGPHGRTCGHRRSRTRRSDARGSRQCVGAMRRNLWPLAASAVDSA